MTQTPLSQMADRGYDKMGEDAGYVLHELKSALAEIIKALEKKADKEDLRDVLAAIENKVDKKTFIETVSIIDGKI